MDETHRSSGNNILKTCVFFLAVHSAQWECFLSSCLSGQQQRSADTGWPYILIALHFAQPPLWWSLYILYRPQLRFVLSLGSIENASKGQFHTRCHTVSFGVVEFFSPHPRALLSAALFSWLWDGNRCWRSWGWLRQDNTSEWKGALGWWTSLTSFILSSERRWSSVRWVPSFPVFAEDTT